MTDLLNTAEAAELLGISAATLRGWILSGAVPTAYRLPGARGPHLLDRATVERIASERRVTRPRRSTTRTGVYAVAVTIETPDDPAMVWFHLGVGGQEIVATPDEAIRLVSKIVAAIDRAQAAAAAVPAVESVPLFDPAA